MLFTILITVMTLSILVAYTSNFFQYGKIGFHAGNVAVISSLGLMLFIIINIFYIITQSI